MPRRPRGVGAPPYSGLDLWPGLRNTRHRPLLAPLVRVRIGYPGCVAIEFSEEIPSLRTTMENILAVVQPDKLREQIAELNEKAAPPTCGTTRVPRRLSPAR